MLIDTEIEALDGMITPFVAGQVRSHDGDPVVSYGLSSVGYDIRLGRDFKAPINDPRRILNPKSHHSEDWLSVACNDIIILPGAFILGVSLERFAIPPDICGTCVGKSTYARMGLIVNVTPLEPGWRGYLTLELSNTGRNPVRVYAGEGIAQIQFHRLSGRPAVTYADRSGKYQDQAAEPTEARI
jgi:dCTP deaminase